jgi:hypothetical protein
VKSGCSCASAGASGINVIDCRRGGAVQGEAIEAVAYDSIDALDTGGGEGFDTWFAMARVMISPLYRVHGCNGYRRSGSPWPR